ncbi:MAG: hypothetical protein B7Y95_18650, partial [Rhizobiales bacterium 32-66-11]
MTADTSISDKIVLTFSGPASAAIYRSLLLGITFTNDADEPNTEPRLIDISLSDGTIHGNVATTTLAVTAVNDAPVLSDPAGTPTVYVRADDGSHGTELWVTDGTAAGTKLLKDINPGSTNASFSGFFDIGGGKFAIAVDDGTHGNELWITDGTDQGTILLKDIVPGTDSSLPYRMTPIGGGKFVFGATDSTHGQELWISDGTEAGTVLLKDIKLGTSSALPASITPLGNGTFLFRANDGTHGQELWISDGTEAGTVLLKDIKPGTGGSFVSDMMAIGGGKFVFPADDGTNGTELWITDGTAAGTTLLKDINPGGFGAAPSGFTSLGGGKFVFSADDGTNGTEPWISDGTAAGTTLLKDIYSGSGPSNASGFTAIGGGKFVFLANEGTHGEELWISDGTAAGTTLLKDIKPNGPSSNASGFTAIGDGKFVFTATDSTHGAELWISDGTEAGTTLLKDINLLGDSRPSGFTPLGDGKFMFHALDIDNGDELWISDGTAAGTTLLSNINPSVTSAFPVILGVGAGAPVPPTPAFTEDGGPVRVAPAVTLTDDGATLSSLVVSLTNALDGAAETLSVAGNLPAGITASYDATTHALTLSGSASPADYQAALRLVAYNNSAQAPHTADRALTIVATDAAGTASSPLSRTVTLTAVNDAPAGTPTAQLAGTEDTALTITRSALLAGFTDADGDILSVTGLTASSGTLANNSDGTWILTPAANFNGPVTLTYNVSDGHGGTLAGQTRTVTFAAVNDAPTGSLTVAGTPTQGETLTASNTFADPDGFATAVSYQWQRQNVNGTWYNITGAKGSSYVLTQADVGAPVRAVGSYVDAGGKVEGAVSAATAATANVNDAPVAGSFEYIAQEDEGLILDVAALSTDPDGDALQITAVNGKILTADGVQVTGGVVTLNTQGALLFTPTANYSGPVNFTYTLSDGHGGLSVGQIGINVQPVNDLPVIGADTFTVTERETVVLNLLANASDPENDTLRIASINGIQVPAGGTGADFKMTVAGGTITLGNDGKLTFTAAANYGGDVSFKYTVSDGHGTSTGTVTGTVISVNEAPVAGNFEYTAKEDEALILDVAGQSTDPDGDALQVTEVDGKILTAEGVQVTGGLVTLNAQGALLFIPTANYNGPVNFTYTLSDGHGGLSDGQIDIIVQPVNDLPVAGNDTFSINEDTVATFNVLGNDSDVDGGQLTIRAINGVAVKFPDDTAEAEKSEKLKAAVSEGSSNTAIAVEHGTVQVNSDGSLKFTPDSNFSGTTSFTYTVSDEDGGT